MNDLTQPARTSARRALLLVLVCAVVAWLLFAASAYVAQLGSGSAAEYTEEPPPARMEFSRYLIFAAIALFGLGALAALRSTAKLKSTKPHTELAQPVHVFSAVSLIIAAVLSAFACIALFFDGFFDSTDGASALIRTINLYLPILLHTALVVTLILAGFVFAPRAAVPTAPAAPPAQSTNFAASSSTPDSSSTDITNHAGNNDSADHDHTVQRSIALGFTVPLVAAALALIAGLIVADATGAASLAWPWAIVIAVIGVGVVAGTRASLRAIPLQSNGPLQLSAQPRGAAVGAKNLNFVLAIVLAGCAAVMSLGYATSAVANLNSAPWLSVTTGWQDAPDGNSNSWSVTGSELRAGSKVEVTVTSNSTEIDDASPAVDRDGWLWADGQISPDLAPGDYTVEATGTSRDGRDLTASAQFTLQDNGELEEISSVDSYADAPPLMASISLPWLAAELLPAGLLLVIAAGVLYLVITTRARELQAVPDQNVSA